MDSYKVDLHLHSWYSDGTMKPTDLVRMYQEQGYDMIALTDHDGVDGVAEARIAGEALHIQVIPGIELGTDCCWNGAPMEAHILGYYIDPDNADLQEALVGIRADRHARNTALLDRLQAQGYALTEADLQKKPAQTYVGKPDFARALRRKGYAIDDIWALLDQVPRRRIPTEQAIGLIRGAGGIAVLAHPMKLHALGAAGSAAFWDDLGSLLRQLRSQGLRGLECYHPSATEEDSLRLVSLAEKLHLHITAGSDFHGA